MTLKSADTLLDVLQFATGHAAIDVPELGIVVTFRLPPATGPGHGRRSGVGGHRSRRSRRDCIAEWLAGNGELPGGLHRGNGRAFESRISL